jgi:hypothetical protein
MPVNHSFMSLLIADKSESLVPVSARSRDELTIRSEQSRSAAGAGETVVGSFCWTGSESGPERTDRSAAVSSRSPGPLSPRSTLAAADFASHRSRNHVYAAEAWRQGQRGAAYSEPPESQRSDPSSSVAQEAAAYRNRSDSAIGGEVQWGRGWSFPGARSQGHRPQQYNLLFKTRHVLGSDGAIGLWQILFGQNVSGGLAQHFWLY